MLMQDLDTEIIVATTRGPSTNTTAVAANVVVDERQMNALFLDVVRVSESYGLRFPREFALLMKQLLYFDRYTRLLAPNLNMLQDQRITIVSNRGGRNRDTFNESHRSCGLCLLSYWLGHPCITYKLHNYSKMEAPVLMPFLYDLYQFPECSIVKLVNYMVQKNRRHIAVEENRECDNRDGYSAISG
ncbi:putative aarF domain-containing protein kinase, chloroplastic [Vitis vinifera]|uniref:Putative aarF domain-containing protein kinase, chloroplastic n=1 Tax=Vitis vinifera TaxID=29760 RepID=A0A438E3U9_VITVI|nr:putative aarF domain-containing protein kinase, chloroplastic [Vitis vinifera]